MTKLGWIASLCLASTAFADAKLTSWYSQEYFKLIVGSGGDCYEAKANFHENLEDYRVDFAESDAVDYEGFSRVVQIPTIVQRTCTHCAVTGNHRSIACGVKGTAEYFVTLEVTGTGENEEKTYSGKPTGKPIPESPSFHGQGRGLDCLEATHNAEVALFKKIEKGNTQYQFGDIQTFSCGCDRKSYPFFATCRTTIHALRKDTRAKN